MMRVSPGVPSRTVLCLFTVLLAAMLQGCSGSSFNQRQPAVLPSESEEDRAPTTGTRGEICCAMADRVPAQEALAQAAARFVGRTRIEAGNRHFTPDCSGLVRGVYATQGIDLYRDLGELDGGNGVGRIYTHAVEHGRIHYGPIVHPGDLVFFHNTWDFNRDGVPNDPLTHVGIVEKVEIDGTVVFVSWVTSGVERYRMNLMMPDTHKAGDGHVLNDFMRRKGFGDPKSTRYLTGQLFAAFGTLLDEHRAAGSFVSR